MECKVRESEINEIRIVSLLHGLFTTVGSIYCLFDKNIFSDEICGYSDLAQFFLAVTTGYMFYV
jgi:hypothetical protein